MGYLVLRFNSTEGCAPAVRYLVLSDSALQKEQGIDSLTEVETIGVMNTGIEATPAGLAHIRVKSLGTD